MKNVLIGREIVSFVEKCVTLNTDQDGLLWNVAQIVRKICTRKYCMLLKKRKDGVMLMRLSSVTKNTNNSYDISDLV